MQSRQRISVNYKEEKKKKRIKNIKKVLFYLPFVLYLHPTLVNRFFVYETFHELDHTLLFEISQTFCPYFSLPFLFIPQLVPPSQAHFLTINLPLNSIFT